MQFANFGDASIGEKQINSCEFTAALLLTK